MTITFSLNTEQQEVLDANVPEGETAETFLTNFCLGYINTLAARAYEASVVRLGEAARALPYETRVALIQQVEAAVSN